MSYLQRRRFLWILFLIGLALVAVAARATTLVRLRFPELVRYSSAIGRVHYVGAEVHYDKGEIWTDTSFEVIEREKGYLPAYIVVRQPGGKFNHLQSHVEGAPEFRPGEELILFLWGTPGKPYSVLGWTQGTFRIRRNARDGSETITQDSSEIPVFDPQANEFTKTGIRNVRIEIFEEKMHKEINRQLQ
ncbi:MAG TPA: hypothetical protein VGF19_04265 [Candidatus Acidoferrum sp.]|jgi:hypothetical protein